jgi:hypothetical protein
MNIFRLLVPATDSTSLDVPFVELCGSRWILTEYMPLADAPKYTCLSYSWGKGRTKNVFDNELLMSDRTLPAIEEIIHAWQQPFFLFLNKTFTFKPFIFLNPERLMSKSIFFTLRWKLRPLAIWVDALCIPSQDPARTVCLQSMGAIYSVAIQVFAVLSESCANSLCQIRDTGLIDYKTLLTLETEDWIIRAWTYQEMANSQRIHFIAQGGDGVSILGLDLLYAITMAYTDYIREHGISELKWGVQYPKLTNFIRMIAEHFVVDVLGRPAYQVMSVAEQRVSERAEDKFYAMIGAITTEPLDGLDNETLLPAEYFMRVCEMKGDYSFIYCVAPRSKIQGKGWRPVAGQIPPVISWFDAFGNGQSGCVKETHLQLNNMCRMSPGSLKANGIKAIVAFLKTNNIEIATPCDFANAILETLRLIGFSGCGDYIELDDGYFFSQSPIIRSEDMRIVISKDLDLIRGNLGLLLRSNGTDIYDFCDVGVFIGRLSKVGESINVG